MAVDKPSPCTDVMTVAQRLRPRVPTLPVRETACLKGCPASSQQSHGRRPVTTDYPLAGQQWLYDSEAAKVGGQPGRETSTLFSLNGGQQQDWPLPQLVPRGPNRQQPLVNERAGLSE